MFKLLITHCKKIILKTKVPNFSLKKFITNTKIDQLFYLLIISDLVFILLHCLVRLGVFEQYYKILSLNIDQSMPEAFQYVKELWVVLLMGIAYLKRKETVYLIWTLLFTFFLVDDFAGVHEHLGGVIALLPAMDFISKDVGEFLGVALIGLLFLGIFLIAFFKSKRKVRRASVTLGFLVSALLFFGIAVDLIHAAFRGSSLVIYEFLALVEDGGEMLVMTLILWFAINMKHFNKSLYKKGYQPFPRLFPKLVL